MITIRDNDYLPHPTKKKKKKFTCLVPISFYAFSL